MALDSIHLQLRCPGTLSYQGIFRPVVLRPLLSYEFAVLLVSYYPRLYIKYEHRFCLMLTASVFVFQKVKWVSISLPL